MRKTLAAVLTAALAAGPAAAEITPPSSSHVKIETAEIYDFVCSRRPFKMEKTRDITRQFSHMGRQVSKSKWHPHSIILGIAGTIILIPMTVLAVPVDLVSAPFRKECRFTLKVVGGIDEWAGRAVPDVEVRLGGRTILKKGIPEQSRPVFHNTEASAITDQDGRFALEIAGKTVISKHFALLWVIDRRPAGKMDLVRHGKTFTLSELDPGFGVGVQEMEPLLIEPKAAP